MDGEVDPVFLNAQVSSPAASVSSSLHPRLGRASDRHREIRSRPSAARLTTTSSSRPPPPRTWTSSRRPGRTWSAPSPWTGPMGSSAASVAQHLEENMVRTIAMDESRGSPAASVCSTPALPSLIPNRQAQVCRSGQGMLQVLSASGASPNGLAVTDICRWLVVETMTWPAEATCEVNCKVKGAPRPPMAASAGVESDALPAALFPCSDEPTTSLQPLTTRPTCYIKQCP